MRRIGLIGCSKKKKSYSTKAQELYQGALFQKSLTLCKLKRFDAIYILSAKHGLVFLDQVLAPYEHALSDMSISQRADWAKKVRQQLLEKGESYSQLWFYCGFLYHQYFIGEKPLEGLGIGRSLSFLTQEIAYENSHGAFRRDGFFDASGLFIR
jgi:hypothetical protein